MLAQAIAAGAALLVAAGSGAQELVDPTRPPALELAAAAGAGVVPGSPLQSILLSSARKGAIINGKYVPLGGAYGDARLINVAATEVTLKSKEKTEVLKLYPEREKLAAAGKSSQAPQAGRRP